MTEFLLSHPDGAVLLPLLPEHPPRSHSQPPASQEPSPLSPVRSTLPHRASPKPPAGSPEGHVLQEEQESHLPLAHFLVSRCISDERHSLLLEDSSATSVPPGKLDTLPRVLLLEDAARLDATKNVSYIWN